MLHVCVILETVTFECVFMKHLCESSVLCQMSKIDSMNARFTQFTWKHWMFLINVQIDVCDLVLLLICGLTRILFQRECNVLIVKLQILGSRICLSSCLRVKQFVYWGMSTDKRAKKKKKKKTNLHTADVSHIVQSEAVLAFWGVCKETQYFAVKHWFSTCVSGHLQIKSTAEKNIKNIYIFNKKML